MRRLRSRFLIGVRCIDGRLMEHRPQHDDPDLEVDIGECEECEGRGCARLEEEESSEPAGEEHTTSSQ